MSKRSTTLRPFLAQYEVEIPQSSPTGKIEYDESRMILLVDGNPAANASDLIVPNMTKDTFVRVETTDDN